MFWKFRKHSITIPVELHDKISRSCPMMNQVESEVLGIRPVRRIQIREDRSKRSHDHRYAYGA